MNLYFVRHGLTELNAALSFQTHNTPLSAAGVQQAQWTADRFVGYNIEEIVSSSMARARQTAEIVSRRLGCPLVVSPLLDEQKRPKEIRGRSKSELEVVQIISLIERHRLDANWHFSDEENIADLRARGQAALDFLKLRQRNNVIVVTHGEILKMLVSLMTFGEALTADMFDKIRQTFATANTGISLVEYERNSWRMIAWNDEAHLGNLSGTEVCPRSLSEKCNPPRI